MRDGFKSKLTGTMGGCKYCIHGLCTQYSAYIKTNIKANVDKLMRYL